MVDLELRGLFCRFGVMKKHGTKLFCKEELHKLMIDEYYANGFCGYKAVLFLKPDLTIGGAGTYFKGLCKIPENKAYMEEKVSKLREETNIKGIQVLRELIQFSFSDITDYMDLTVEELKDLPGDLRRCIQTFKKKTTRYLPRGAKKGEEVEDTTIEIKLFDKMKALEMINKHIGFYSEDNKQKTPNINLTNLPQATLNILLQNIETE
jgi:phage terminase small subunit